MCSAQAPAADGEGAAAEPAEEGAAAASEGAASGTELADACLVIAKLAAGLLAPDRRPEAAAADGLTSFLLEPANAEVLEAVCQQAAAGAAMHRIAAQTALLAVARPALLRSWANFQAPSQSHMSHCAC